MCAPVACRVTELCVAARLRHTRRQSAKKARVAACVVVDGKGATEGLFSRAPPMGSSTYAPLGGDLGGDSGDVESVPPSVPASASTPLVAGAAAAPLSAAPFPTVQPAARLPLALRFSTALAALIAVGLVSHVHRRDRKAAVGYELFAGAVLSFASLGWTALELAKRNGSPRPPPAAIERLFGSWAALEACSDVLLSLLAFSACSAGGAGAQACFSNSGAHCHLRLASNFFLLLATSATSVSVVATAVPALKNAVRRAEGNTLLSSSLAY